MGQEGRTERLGERQQHLRSPAFCENESASPAPLIAVAEWEAHGANAFHVPRQLQKQ